MFSIIKVENLNLKFENSVIFENCSVEIPKDKVTIITGLNGAGKSTLLKIITGGVKADCKITNEFKNVFYLPQNPYFPAGFTTFDYLSTIFFKNNWKWFLNAEEKEKIDNILETIELKDKRDLNIELLSGGEFQKVNIALGLLSDADLFLLDEPASSLDLVNQIKILDMIKKLTAKSITSAVILHDLNLASAYGDYFIGLTRGMKPIQAERNEFFTKENLKKIYGIDFKIVNEGDKVYAQVLN